MAGNDIVKNKAALVVVSRGKAKVWDRRPDTGAVPAKDAYVSSLFKLCCRFAEATGNPWVILSAKYGFLDPTDPIAQYDVAFGKSDDAITNDDLLRQWTNRFGHVHCVISLASNAYDMRLMHAIGKDVTLKTPLKGKNLFDRTKWLKRERLSI